MRLSCTDLSIRYGRRQALTGLTLAIGSGEIHAVIGPNGSGKSTALQAIAGLVRPDRGHAEIDGRPVAAMSRRQIARRLAFLPQQPVAPDEMSVAELARQGRFARVGLFRSYAECDERAILWALESTGLRDCADRSLGELSGGERQRAWIAAALAQEAGILVLDEPTSFLDLGFQIEVLDLLHRLSRERGVTVVMAIHDLNQAMAISDNLSLLRSGRLAFHGTPDALAASGLIEDVFRVRGHFVQIAPQAPPHFSAALARWSSTEG